MRDIKETVMVAETIATLQENGYPEIKAFDDNCKSCGGGVFIDHRWDWENYNGDNFRLKIKRERLYIVEWRIGKSVLRDITCKNIHEAINIVNTIKAFN